MNHATAALFLGGGSSALSLHMLGYYTGYGSGHTAAQPQAFLVNCSFQQFQISAACFRSWASLRASVQLAATLGDASWYQPAECSCEKMAD